MSAFKLQTLKQKLWAIVAASVVARVIIFFALPNTPSSFAPDEGGYSEIARRIATGEAIGELDNLSKTSQTLVFPGAILVRIGLDPLSATRLSALIYGFATLAYCAYFISKEVDNHLDAMSRHKNTLNLVLILFAIYSFLPSHLLWSTLALRESTMEMWVVLIFGSIFSILYHSEKSNRWNFLTLIFSIFLLFNTRLQVGLLLAMSLMISLLFLFKVRNAQRVFVIVATTSILSFGSLIAQPNLETSETIPEKVNRLLGFDVSQITSITNRQEINQADASSLIQTISCPFDSNGQINTVACLIWRAPYMTTTFLIRPIIGLDVTSRSSLFAAVENLLWTVGFAFCFYRIVKKKKIPFIKPLLPSVVFFVLYSLGAGSYQGNMGTAFRHKSLILWAILLTIFALAWKKSEKTSEKARNNSQESAV
jgi:hypothetical protein